MAAAVARLGDMQSGHGPFPPTPCTIASPNVFANFIPVARQADPWAIHCLGPACHVPMVAVGAPTVFTNNKGTARLGDAMACGGVVVSGSANIFA
jgi:uncharacterized Zn-binding protein involved in type VI secretion